MLDGDELRLTKEGLALSREQAASLRLGKDSVAWGVWVEGRRGRTWMKMCAEDSKEFNPKHQGPHMMISAIHPDLWPACVMVEARLSRQNSELVAFLERLSELGVNVLVADTVIAGYDLQVFQAICEINALSGRVGQVLEEMQAQVQRDRGTGLEQYREARKAARRDAFRKIGAVVLPCVAAIEAQLRLEDLTVGGAESGGFLEHTSIHLGALPWFLTRWNLRPTDANLHAMRFGLLRAYQHPAQGFHDLYDDLREKLRKSVDGFGRGAHPDRGEGRHGACDYNPAASEDPYLSPGDDTEHGGNAWAQLQRIWKRHSIEPVTCRALTTLAYASVWRVWEESVDGSAFGPTRPIRFKFKCDGAADRGVLVAQPPGRAIPAPDLGWVQAQLKALTSNEESDSLWRDDFIGLATFNRAERSMRVRFMRPWFSKHYAWRLSIRYRMVDSAAPGSSTASQISSRGLLANICGALTSMYRLRVERVTTELIESTPQSEEGRIGVLLKAVWDGDDKIKGTERRKEMQALTSTQAIWARVHEAVEETRRIHPLITVIVEPEDVEIVPLAHAGLPEAPDHRDGEHHA